MDQATRASNLLDAGKFQSLRKAATGIGVAKLILSDRRASRNREHEAERSRAEAERADREMIQWGAVKIANGGLVSQLVQVPERLHEAVWRRVEQMRAERPAPPSGVGVMPLNEFYASPLPTRGEEPL